MEFTYLIEMNNARYKKGWFASESLKTTEDSL